MAKKETWALPVAFDGQHGERPVAVRLAGRFTEVSHHAVHHRILEESVAIFCVWGCGWYTLGDKKGVVGPGDLLLLPPGLPHGYGNTPEGAWSILWFHFSGTETVRLLGQSKADPVFHSAYSPELQASLEQLFNLIPSVRSFVDVLRVDALFTEFLCLPALQEKEPQADCVAAEGYVQKAIYYFSKHENRLPSLEETARYVGVSKFYLIKLFQKYQGLSPMEYMKAEKMKRACRLLLETHLSVAEIGELLGYSSPYHLSKCFKERFGYSPRQFRSLTL